MKMPRGDEKEHVSQKPVDFVVQVIGNHRGTNIYEPFAGSGSTLIACHKTNRRCFGCEIDPHYVDVAIRRWMDYSGEEAYLEGSDGSKTAYSKIVPQVLRTI